MKLGLQIPDFTWPGGPSRLGADLAQVARTADAAGFDRIAVMDHVFQIEAVGPAEHDMLEAHKLDVLRAHCEAEGRDYDAIEKTCYFLFDPGEKGEKTGEIVDGLGKLAEMGFQSAIGGMVDVWRLDGLEAIGNEVIPQVANL